MPCPFSQRTPYLTEHLSLCVRRELWLSIQTTINSWSCDLLGDRSGRQGGRSGFWRWELFICGLYLANRSSTDGGQTCSSVVGRIHEGKVRPSPAGSLAAWLPIFCSFEKGQLLWMTMSFIALRWASFHTGTRIGNHLSEVTLIGLRVVRMFGFLYKIKAGPLDLNFWSFLNFLHHDIEKVEGQLVWKLHKRLKGKVGQMRHWSCSLV